MKLFYDDHYKLWTTTLTIGDSKVQVAVDTGSPYLVINSSQCSTCPPQYGMYKDACSHEGQDRIEYATQTVRVDFRNDYVAELKQRIVFATAIADKDSTLPPVNVLGIRYSQCPRSVCAQLGNIPITLDFRNRLLTFNAINPNATYIKWPIYATVKNRREHVLIDVGTSFTRGTSVAPGQPYNLDLGKGVLLRAYNEPNQSAIRGFDIVLGHNALRNRILTFAFRNNLVGFG